MGRSRTRCETQIVVDQSRVPMVVRDALQSATILSLRCLKDGVLARLPANGEQK